jgi:hypothetical protein
VGVCSLAVTLRNVKDHFTWDFAGVYGLIPIWIEDFFRMSWLVYSVEFALVHWE